MKEGLAEVFSDFEGKENELIPVLQDVQKEFGYLPEAAMREVARFVGVPESQVYAVATFYAQFRFKPAGRCRVTVCRGTACHVRGSARILDEIEKELTIEPGQTTEDGAFSLETVACVGSCALAPVAVVNDKVHGKMSTTKLRKVLDQFRRESEAASEASETKTKTKSKTKSKTETKEKKSRKPAAANAAVANAPGKKNRKSTPRRQQPKG